MQIVLIRLQAYNSGMNWIDPQDLDAWAGHVDAQAGLPALTRRLALSTTLNPRATNIPSGSSVNLAGWDGRFESDGGAFLPAGQVVFEMSCGADAAAKAKENYEKRTKDPLGISPAETTFIFITPRVWAGAEKWAEERIAEKVWKDVKAYDAGLLAQWIDTAPVIASAFAREIGKVPPSGFIALSDFWEEWSKATSPATLPSLLTGGRAQQADSLKAWVKGAPNAFFVEGENKDEAIAFFAAWATTEPEVGEYVLDRAVVITTHEAWLSLSRSKIPMFLLPNFNEEYSASTATGNGHHVLTPLERGERMSGEGCVLSRQDRDSFLNALKEMGINDHERNSLASGTGRHLPTLRRRLIDHAGGKKPWWTEDATARSLLPALLLGQWTGKEDDLTALSVLAGKSAAEVLSEYQTYLTRPDSPLRRVGDHWRLTSHEEAWELLSPHLSKAETDRFYALAVEVLSELSPALDMPQDERHLAGIQKKTLSRSETVREGMATTLALMACRADRLTAETSSIPMRVMRDVLETSSADWRFWATTGSELSIFAEAAPDQVLDAIEAGLNLQPSPFLQLFKEEGSGIWGACYHSGLLWALERLGMSTDYFARAALALARLAAIDPGGKYSNRPLESLRGLFLGWIRYTDASDEERLKALDMIYSRAPEAGWKLLMELAPSGHESITGRTPASYRTWGQEMLRGTTNGEFHAYLMRIIELILDKVGNDPAKWEGLLPHIPSLSESDQDRAFSQLETAVKETEDKNQWSIVRAEMRDMLNRHLTYSDMDWAMTPERTERLGKIYEALTPTDPIAANAWVFDYWPHLPEAGNRLTDDTSARAEELQKASFSQIFDEKGVEGISELIEAAANGGKVGYIAGKFFSNDPAIRELVIKNLGSETFPKRAFSSESAFALFGLGGWEQLEPLLEEARAAGVGESALASIYFAAKVGKETWDRLEKEPEETQKSYWSNLNTHVLSIVDANEYEYGARKLLDYNKAPDLIDAMAYGREDLPVELMVRALELAPKNLAAAAEAKTPIRVSSHDIARVFQKLDEANVDEKTIARLEVPFAQMLHIDRPNLVLHREVVRDATTFADLVSWVYKRSDGEIDDDGITEEEREGRAHTAWSILHNISVLPGQKADGTIDIDAQRAWVDEALRLCKERGRDVVGRHAVGDVLGSSPVGTDGAWPHESVRATLDRLADKEVGLGFTIRKQNMRGMISRGLYDGGEQERKIAEGYRKDAAALRSEYPFTASLLNDLANTYDYQARYEDNESAWMDR